MAVLRALIGIAGLCLVAWVLSGKRGRVAWRPIVVGVVTQVILGYFILYTDAGKNLFTQMSAFVTHLMGLTEEGTNIVFGEAMSKSSGKDFVFAFAGRGLPTIIFFSALMAVLYYIGIMQAIIWCLARVMSIGMGVSGAEGMAMAANIFVGQTEAALTVKTYIARMTNSEITCLMTGGFATMSAGMIAIYTGIMGKTYGPHILAAEVLSAPAAIVMAKLLMPETEHPVTGAQFPLKIERDAHNVLEAAATGTRDGLMLFLNVIAMLIAFSAMVKLIDWPLGALGEGLHLTGGLSLGRIFGWVLAPIAWLIGIEGWGDCQRVGGVLGLKVATNEFVAFLQLAKIIPAAGSAATQEAASAATELSGILPPRASILATYAICDFANFVSVGIQIGGLTPMAPDRKRDFAALALRSMIGGCLASWMTAAVAGIYVR